VEKTHTHIHTYMKALPTNLCCFTKPLLEGPQPLHPLFHKEYFIEKCQFSNYNGNIYLQLCVPLFDFSVSWFSEMEFGVIYFKTWGSTQPYLNEVILLCIYIFTLLLYIAIDTTIIEYSIIVVLTAIYSSKVNTTLCCILNTCILFWFYVWSNTHGTEFSYIA